MENNYFNDFNEERKPKNKTKPASWIVEIVLCLAAFGVSRLLGLVCLFVICKKNDWI